MLSVTACGGARTDLWTPGTADLSTSPTSESSQPDEQSPTASEPGNGRANSPPAETTPGMPPTEPGEGPAGVESPDSGGAQPANYVAVLCSDAAETGLYAVGLAEGEGAQVVALSESATSVVWTEDGKHLAFQSSDRLGVADFSSSPPSVTELQASEIAADRAITKLGSVAWIDDEYLLVAAYPSSDSPELWLLTSELAFAENILDAAAGLIGPGTAFPSPNGSSIVFSMQNDTSRVELYLSEREPVSATQFSHPTRAFSVLPSGVVLGPQAFSPDGHYFAFVPTADPPLGLGSPEAIRIEGGAEELAAPEVPEDSATLQVTWAPNTGLLAYLVQTVVDGEAFVDVYVYDAEAGTSEAFLGHLEHRSAGIVGWDATGQALAVNGRFGDETGSSLRILTPAAEESGARHFMQEDFPDMKAMSSSNDHTEVLFVSEEQIYSVPYLSTGVFDQLTRAPAEGLSIQNYRINDDGALLYFVHEPSDWQPPARVSDTDVPSGGLYFAEDRTSTRLDVPAVDGATYDWLPDQSGALVATQRDTGIDLYWLPDVRSQRRAVRLNDALQDCEPTSYLIPPAWD